MLNIQSVPSTKLVSAISHLFLISAALCIWIPVPLQQRIYNTFVNSLNKSNSKQLQSNHSLVIQAYENKKNNG